MHRINLVEECDTRHPGRLYAFENVLVFFGPARRFDDEQGQIGIGQGAYCGAVHQPVHRAAGIAVQPGRVDENYLLFLSRPDRQYPVPRGLRFRGDNTHFPAHHRVDQRRLADIWPANDGHETAAKRVVSHALHSPSAGPAYAGPLAARHCAASDLRPRPAPAPAPGIALRIAAGGPCRSR